MAIQLAPVPQPDPMTVEAVATKVVDRWAIDVLGAEPLAVRVKSLEDVDAAVNEALGHRARLWHRLPGPPVYVHIYWYH